MVGNEAVVSIVFRLLNFAAVLGLFAYLFKRYALDLIKSQMHEKEQRHEGLKQQTKELEHEEKKMGKALADQERLYKEITKKIQIWHSSFEQILKDRFDEKERLRAFLIEKKAQQEKSLIAHRIHGLIFSSVLQRTSDQLVQKFIPDAVGRSFLLDVVAKAEKSLQ